MIVLPMYKLVVSSILLVAALGTAGAQARPLCEPTSAKGNPAWSRIYVKNDDLKAGRQLLGLDGSRIRVRDTWPPVPGENGASNRPWHTRVDWTSYAQPADDAPSSTVLYFDTDESGTRFPCRVEAREWTEQFLTRSGQSQSLPKPTAADIRVSALTKLAYDSHGRIAGVIEYRLDDQRAALARTTTECFHYNKTDGFLGASIEEADACTSASPARIQERFVYTADGKLLRRIDSEKTMAGLDGKPFVTREAHVLVFDEQGQPRAEYVENEEKRHYRRNLADKDDLTKYRAIKLIASAKVIDVAAIQAASPPGFWQFFSLPTKVANADDGVNDARYLVASGQNQPVSASDKEKLWDLLNRPGHDLILDAQGRFILVPEILPPVWKACVSLDANTPAACP
jgi:hypothetical protein